MPEIALSILSLLRYAPQAISEITAVYNSVRGDISETDQATIDKALADAQAADAQATTAADDKLDQAAQR